MAFSESFNVTLSDHMKQPLRDVLQAEGGKILNDYYTFNHYLTRRADHLQRTRNLRGTSLSAQEVARLDASTVFGTCEKLSVQQVRREELLSRVYPLLPLPTRNNTDTANDFRGYSAQEWTPFYEQPGASSTFALAAGQGVRSLYTMLPRASSFEDAIDQPSPCSSPPDFGSFSSANITGTARSNKQTPAMDSGISSPMLDQTSPITASTMATSPLTHDIATSSTHMLQAPPPAIQLDEQQPLVNHTQLGTGPQPPPQGRVKPSTKDANPSTVTASDKAPNRIASSTPSTVSPILRRAPFGVSSLANSPMIIPVKPQTNGKRAAAATEPITTSSTSKDKPPTRKSSPERPPASTDTRSGKGTNKRARSPSVDPQPPAKKPKLKIITHLESVVSGRTLPDNAKEAFQAAKARLKQLKAENAIAATKARSKRARDAANAKVDFMPEFFDSKSFPADPDAQEVRCVCGAVKDPDIQGEYWVQCEKCPVWQHWECVGFTGGDYSCQVCDPWSHRELIQKIRRGEEL